MKSEGLTPAQLAERNAEYVTEISRLEKACAALAAENAGIKSAIPESRDIEDDNDNMDDVSLAEDFGFNHAIELMRRRIPETPATDAFLAEVRAEARNEGINYTASRLAAAFNHGFINKSFKKRHILTELVLSTWIVGMGYNDSFMPGVQLNDIWQTLYQLHQRLG